MDELTDDGCLQNVSKPLMEPVSSLINCFQFGDSLTHGAQRSRLFV
jgi:hypothetical protein